MSFFWITCDFGANKSLFSAQKDDLSPFEPSPFSSQPNLLRTKEEKGASRSDWTCTATGESLFTCEETETGNKLLQRQDLLCWAARRRAWVISVKRRRRRCLSRVFDRLEAGEGGPVYENENMCRPWQHTKTKKANNIFIFCVSLLSQRYTSQMCTVHV